MKPENVRAFKYKFYFSHCSIEERIRRFVKQIDEIKKRSLEEEVFQDCAEDIIELQTTIDRLLLRKEVLNEQYRNIFGESFNPWEFENTTPNSNEGEVK